VKEFLSGVMERARIRPRTLELRSGVAPDRHMDRCRASNLLRGAEPHLWNLWTGEVDGAALSVFNFSNGTELMARNHTVALVEDPRLASAPFSLQWSGWNTRTPGHELVDVPMAPGYSAHYCLTTPGPTIRLSSSVVAFFAKRREVMAECVRGAVWLARYHACSLPEVEELVRAVFELSSLLSAKGSPRRLGRVLFFDQAPPDRH
jgi:hypothetical protein